MAFDSHCSGCRRECVCGRVFWDNYNSGYTWEDGELEELEKNPKATPIGHSIGVVIFEGREYVMDCDCWHKRAEQIMGFIDYHAVEIAKYLTLEKERKQEAADVSPTVG